MYVKHVSYKIVCAVTLARGNLDECSYFSTVAILTTKIDRIADSKLDLERKGMVRL